MSLVKIRGSLAYLKRALIQLKKGKNWKYFFLIFQGFTPDKGFLYDFDKFAKSKYLTDYWRYVNTHNINARFSPMFNDKLSSYFFQKSFTNAVVPILGYIYNDRIHFLNDTVSEADTDGVRVILKDKNGYGGFGVTKAILSNGKLLSINGTSEIQLQEFSNYIIVPTLYNSKYARTIYSKTLNTLRILTGVIDDEVIIIRAIHRFGNDKTGVVDNFSNGGISANIDLITGIIDSVVYRKDDVKCMVEVHPSTNAKIKGIQIPKWHELRSFVQNLHTKISYVRYIGWDIAVCDDGIYVIEMNHISDIDLIQVHSPLLIDSKAESFFKTNFN